MSGASDAWTSTGAVTSERSPVLIVDDRPANRIALRGILEPLDFAVVEADSGEDALRRLLERDFALVLLDVDMPDMDGFQTAEYMRRHPRTRHIPIIFLTAFDDLLDRAHEGYAFGAVDYIAKPFDPEMLRSKVRVFLELHQKTALLERQTRQLETSIEQLRLSRTALADAQRIANLGNFEYDPRTGRVRGSRQLHDIFGESQDAPLPPAMELFERLRLRPDGQSGEVLIRSATRANFDGELTRSDGTTRDIVVHVEPRPDTLTIVGTMQDVTEHREAQRALDETTRALERERELVHVFQQTVVAPAVEPSSRFDVSYCYRPADAAVVGGDWYDVLPLPNGHVLLVIGDVGGHGLSAASAMSEIRTVLRLASISEERPGRLIERVDRYLATFRGGTFATMLLVRFDQDTGECVMASAGHLPAVEFGPGEPEVKWAPSGPPVGAASVERKEATFVLGVGRSLALYTDGLVERRGELIDDGIGRLQKCLAVLRVEELSLAEATVREMCRDTGLTDDVAMLVVRRNATDGMLRVARPAEPSEIARLRIALRRWLDETCADKVFAEDIVLTASELATNACIHAYRPGQEGMFFVDGKVDDGQLELVVRDNGKWRSPREGFGGRGLVIARAMASEVSVEPSTEGTTVRVKTPFKRNAGTPVPTRSPTG